MLKVLSFVVGLFLTFVQWIIVMVAVLAEKIINVFVAIVGFFVGLMLVLGRIPLSNGLKLAFILFCFWCLPHIGYWLNDKISILKGMLSRTSQ